jgi:RND family efflux transporter MFP subunit
MKIRLLLLCCLLALAACDGPPATGAKPPQGDRATLVETALAQSADVTRTIERNGSLRPLREAHLSLQQEGRLLTLPYHEGEAVEQGALLAQLDDTLLQAQLKKGQAQRLQAEQDLKRLQRLQSSRVIAEDELARAVTLLEVARAEEEELQVLLRQTRIMAPFSGVISERLAEPGDTVSRFSHLLTLIDVHSLYTELKLSEMVLPGLAIGDAVSLTIDALGPKQFSGTIARIHPLVDEASRQGTIEVMLSPPPAGAIPGQLCRVALPLRSRARLLVPYNALRRDTRGEFLLVVGNGNKVERRAIVSGLHFDERIEILRGLSSGERIVTRGFLGLSEGSTVKLAGDTTTP